MEHKVLNKRCFIRKNRRAYCSKCGKMQLQDTYNMGKHAKECKFSKYDMVKLFEDKEGLAYAFYIRGDKLYFYGLTVELQLRPGFRDKYTGGKWKNIFEAVFSKDSREVVQRGRYNVDFWMKTLVDEKKIVCLNAEDPIAVVNDFFPNVLGVYSLESFLEIYRNRGYAQNILDVKEKYAASLANRAQNCTQEKAACISSFHCGDELVLQLDLKDGEEWKRILLSKNFLYSEGALDVRALVERDLLKEMRYGEMDLEHFVKCYPELMLENYFKSGGRNIVVPFLAPYYHKFLEQMTKSGLGAMAEQFFQIVDENKSLDFSKKNLKELFGISLNYLRKIQKDKNLARHLSIFQKLYHYNPAFIDMEHYSNSYFDFILHNDFVEKKENYHSILGVSRWSDKDILKVLKYLNNQTGTDVYLYYRDYIEMCRRMNNFRYGLTPKNLKEVHDEMQKNWFMQKNAWVAQSFQNAICREAYTFLASDYVETGKDGKKKENELKEEDYKIILPAHPIDLMRESDVLHHCVKTYINRVSEGRTYILFLRKKDKLQIPFATIEVLPDYRLIQLKAINNSKAPEEAKEFVRKWARVKGVRLQSLDITE